MEDIFLILAIFNTEIGLKNTKKNKKRLDRQIRIEEKLDKFLAILSEKIS